MVELLFQWLKLRSAFTFAFFCWSHCTSNQFSQIFRFHWWQDGHPHFRMELVGGQGYNRSTEGGCRQGEGQSLTALRHYRKSWLSHKACMLHTQFYSLPTKGCDICVHVHTSVCVCVYVQMYERFFALCVRVQSFKCIGSFVLQSLLMQSFRPTAPGRRGLIPWGSIWGFLAPRWKISARKESRHPPRWTCGRIAAGYHCASRFSQIWNSGIWDMQAERQIQVYSAATIWIELFIARNK